MTNSLIDESTAFKQKAKYRITQVDAFWRYHIYRRTWRGWKRIGGRDSIDSCEGLIRDEIDALGGIFYDAAGKRLP